MKNTFFHRVVRQTPTRFWINNVTEEEARNAIAHGATGCTQNPSYTHKILTHADARAREAALGRVKKHLAHTANDNEVEIAVQKELVNAIAEVFLPLYEASGGLEGYVSIQGDPLQEDEATITRLARFHREGTHPNIMAKIPATEDGIKALDALMREGVPLNITEVFALAQVKEICDLYNAVKADKKADKKGDMPVVYISHITGIYDEYMHKWAKETKLVIEPDVLYQAGIISAKKTYEYMQAFAPELGFIGGGVRGLQHFTEMMGSKACITMNWTGTVDALLEQDPPVLEHFHRPVSSIVVDELLAKVPAFKQGYLIDGLAPHEFEEFGPVELFRDSFVRSWKEALRIIKNCRG